MGKYQATVEQIKKYIDFQDVFGATHIHCVNPSHEDNHPSAYVYPDHIYCFSCGTVERDIVKAYMKHNKTTFKSAIRQLWYILAMKGARTYQKEQVEIKPIPLNQITEWTIALKLLDSKMEFLKNHYAISPQIIDVANIGYTGTAFSIPHTGGDGLVYNVKFRADPELNLDGPKYWSLKHRKFIHPYPGYLYAEYYQNPPKILAITEGEFDTLANLSHNIPSLATGTASIRPEKYCDFFLKLRDTDTFVYLAFDNDEAGYKIGQRFMEYLDHLGVRNEKANFNGKDTAEHWRLHDKNT